jgi:hypothetical protein
LAGTQNICSFPETAGCLADRRESILHSKNGLLIGDESAEIHAGGKTLDTSDILQDVP